jgi:hypothetical protein
MNGTNPGYLLLALVLQLTASSSLSTIFEISTDYRQGHAPGEAFFTKDPPKGEKRRSVCVLAFLLPPCPPWLCGLADARARVGVGVSARAP